MATPRRPSLSDPPGTLALTFANTRPGSPAAGPDPLATPSDTVVWLTAHVLTDSALSCPRPQWTPPEARALQGEALRLRDAVHALFAAVAIQRVALPSALDDINRVLSAATWSRCMAVEGQTLRLQEGTRTEGPLGALAPVAWAAAEMATTAKPERLRRCAAKACSRWFLDTSKGGRRKWCSMATCGNRAKASRWRSRDTG
jgi:predicted RNA-binding Zn ribbon-like protein